MEKKWGVDSSEIELLKSLVRNEKLFSVLKNAFLNNIQNNIIVKMARGTAHHMDVAGDNKLLIEKIENLFKAEVLTATLLSEMEDDFKEVSDTEVVEKNEAV